MPYGSTAGSTSQRLSRCFVCAGLPRGPSMSMCTFPYAIVNALCLLAGSSALRSSAWRRTGTRRGSLWVRHLGKGVDGWGRSADRAWARPARRCLFFRSDHVCCAGIGLLVFSALPHQIAQTAPTSSMATSAALNRRPASSIVYIFPYAIVAAALSRLAGSSPLAPCARRSSELHISEDQAGVGRSRMGRAAPARSVASITQDYATCM